MTTEQKIKVLLVDDSEILLEGFSVLLAKQPNIEVVGQAHDGREAIDLSCQLHPDVVLMDIRMPVLNGIEATRGILNYYPSIKVIAHSSLLDEVSVEKMSEAGACDFLEKGCGLNKVAKSIEDAVGKIPALTLDVHSSNMNPVLTHLN